ncbi:MAG TPA: hypothetical protein VFC03_18040 [Acidimicrobiales bacterium]|nr:hypothetical protein [Acidimicrobiales bacterium]
MSKQNTAPSQGDDVAERIERIKEVRAQAIEHTRQARRFAVERRDLMQDSSKTDGPRRISPANSA